MTTTDFLVIDTHSHLHGKDFAADLNAVLARAEAAGVAQIALVGVTPEDTDRALSTASENPGRFFVVAGLHPHESSDWNPATRSRIEEQAASAPGLIRAVGEMGLDYHYDFAPRDLQRAAFTGQMEIARAAELPIVIHCREAYNDCMAMLREFYSSNPADNSRPSESDGGGSPVKGVLHCYFGTLEQAHEAVDMGFMLGIGGSCTFKNAQEVHKVVQEIPLEHLVLETDAPYMAPVPYRGKRNESGYLKEVVDRIANLRGISREDVIRQTTRNAHRLYRM